MDYIFISILVQIPVYIGLFITVKKIIKDDNKNKKQIKLHTESLKNTYNRILDLETEIDSLKRKLFEANRDKSQLELELINWRSDYNKLIVEFNNKSQLLNKWMTPRDKKTGKFIPKTK